MVELTISVPDNLVEQLTEYAAKHGWTLEELLTRVLNTGMYVTLSETESGRAIIDDVADRQPRPTQLP